MKKRFTPGHWLALGLSLVGLASVTPSTAQVATTYTFSQSVGTYTGLTGATVIASNALGNMDEDVISVPLPTPFYYDGTPYTSIYVSTNGFITFGSYMPDTYFYEPLSATDPYDGAIAAFGCDANSAQAVAGTRNISYATVGNEFVVQYQNIRRYAVAGERMSCQVRLNTSTGQINIVYGGSLIPGNDQTYPQIGLRGPDNTFATNVNNRMAIATTGAWVNSTAGVDEFSTCLYDSNNPTVVPAAGTTFTWTPGPDVRVTTLTAPVANACFTQNETISVVIKNLGGSTINLVTDPITVNGSVTGPNSATFTPVVLNTGTLASGATQTVTLSTAFDMTAAGSYTFDAATTFTGDVHPLNDAMTSTVVESHNPTVAASSDVSVCAGGTTSLNVTATPHDYNVAFNTNSPVGIPDDDPNGANSTIVITGQPVPASSIMVRVESITHTYMADLTMTLTAPDGSSMVLFAEEGNGDANMTQTLFTASATNPISTGIEPFTGSFLPEDPFTNLTGTANGTWTLNVADNYAFDSGTINSWSIIIPVTNGIATYTWTPSGGLTSTTISNPDATPTGTTTYSVQVTDNSGCSATDEVTVTVNSLPTVVANATATTVCAGSSVTLTGSGATSYTWDNSVTDNVAFNASTTADYIVTGTDANGCSNNDTITVMVNALPVVAANATATTVCAGSSVTLSGSGATSYTWDNSVTDNVAFNATATTNYIVTGTDANGCSNNDTITVTVNVLPMVVANTTAAGVCDGSSVTLSGSGATSYTWDNSVTDNVAFTPAVTAAYIVTGTDANGCTNNDTITITVNTLPAVMANTTAAAVCSGSSVTLTGSGATSYTWDNSVTDNVAFTPTATADYIVTGTDANGCTNMDTITITVNSLPTVGASATTAAVCSGSTVTFNGSGATTYAWTGGVTDNVPFTPSTTDTYTVTGTDANGCQDTATVSVTVNQLPNVTVSLPMSSICLDDASANLTGASPAGGTWSGSGVTGSSFNPSTAGVGPVTITYSYTDGNGCTASAMDNLTVSACTGIVENTTITPAIFPNPTSGQFTIQLNQTPATPVTIEVMNSIGQIVSSFTMSSNTQQVDLSTMESGIYMVRITNGAVISMQRVVKQ